MRIAFGPDASRAGVFSFGMSLVGRAALCFPRRGARL